MSGPGRLKKRTHGLYRAGKRLPEAGEPPPGAARPTTEAKMAKKRVGGRKLATRKGKVKRQGERKLAMKAKPKQVRNRF